MFFVYKINIRAAAEEHIRYMHATGHTVQRAGTDERYHLHND